MNASGRAYLLLGSNVAPAMNLPRAVEHLARIGRVVAASAAVASPAIGPTGRPDLNAPPFLNAAVLLEVRLSVPALRHALRKIEKTLGRVRNDDRFAPRPIDIDIALFNDESLRVEGRAIPDPEILTRKHVAGPLAEIAPGYLHPLTGEPLSEIAQRLGAHQLERHPEVELSCSLKGKE